MERKPITHNAFQPLPIAIGTADVIYNVRKHSLSNVVLVFKLCECYCLDVDYRLEGQHELPDSEFFFLPLKQVKKMQFLQIICWILKIYIKATFIVR